MRAQGEGSPAIGSDSLVSAIWNVYYDRLVRGDGRADFLAALPAADHLATFRWLFPQYAESSNRYAYLFMLAQLQENGGDRADALETYQSLLAMLAAQGADSGTIYGAARRSVQRLQSK
jgi:hypothetical protein